MKIPGDEEAGRWTARRRLRDGRDADKPEITIILPAYNEGKRISRGLSILLASLGNGTFDGQAIEVIVVDDGSDDDTAAQAEDLLASFPRSLVVRLPENRGKGAAIRRGVARAEGNIVVFMDVDMAVHPSQLPSLLAALDENDVVIGSRSMSGSATEDDTLVRTVTGRAFSRITGALIGLPFRDTQCGFKALRAPVARVLCHYTDVDRFAFDVELLWTAVGLGLRVAELPVRWVQVPGSRIRPLADPASMLADLFRIRRRRGSGSKDAIVIRSGPPPQITVESLRLLLSSLPTGREWDDSGIALLPLSDTDEVARVLHLLRVSDASSVAAHDQEYLGQAAPPKCQETTQLRDVSTLGVRPTDQPRRIAN